VILGATKEEVEHRARLQKEAWDARWARFQAAESARQQRINKRQWNDRQADIDRRARDEALKLAKEAEIGPDAYEFIKGKPLTLLSGSELLYLLAKHGYRAKIDIKEAKKLLGEV
jgi:hypothetical protein